MEAQEDNNKQKDAKQQIGLLSQQIKSAFKAGDYEAVKLTAYKIKALDSENRLAEKMINKVQKAKAKEEKKDNLKKVEEYMAMLKKLYKERDAKKLTDLAKEFKDFNPKNKHADKWVKRADKLNEKLGGKTEKEEPMQIMAKKEEAKPEPIKPIVAPIAHVPTPAPIAPAAPAPTVKPVASAIPVAEPAKKAGAKGNIFTKMFSKKEEVTDKKSIIDTIVAKTDKKEKEKTPMLGSKKDEDKNGSLKLLTFSKVFMNFAAIFIVFSAAFLYVEWIDTGNTLLSLVGVPQNTGGRLHSTAEEVKDLKKQETALNASIELYKGGYNDKAISDVDEIITNRINWPDIFSKINEVTNSVYELNDFFKYIEYSNYSLDVDKGAIRVSGSLSDPLGRNLTKLVELEEAFIYYPIDRNDPDDTTRPYFTGFNEFTSFSKTLDESTGRYTSSFQLSFSLN